MRTHAQVVLMEDWLHLSGPLLCTQLGAPWCDARLWQRLAAAAPAPARPPPASTPTSGSSVSDLGLGALSASTFSSESSDGNGSGELAAGGPHPSSSAAPPADASPPPNETDRRLAPPSAGPAVAGRTLLGWSSPGAPADGAGVAPKRLIFL